MARIPRIPSRKDIENLDLRKRSAPVGRKEDLHERMARELTNLKRDRRFWEGDKAYQRYVQLQFERVYNDPSGKPQPLRIGPPKIFATDIEPFGADSQRTKSRQRHSQESSTDPTTYHVDEAQPVGPGRNGISTSPPVRDPSVVMRQDEELEAPSASLQALGSELPGLGPMRSSEADSRVSETEDEPGLYQKTRDFFEILNAGEGSDEEVGLARASVMLEKFRDYGWKTAERLLLHYLGGSGEPVSISPRVLGEFPTMRLAYGGVMKSFAEWLVGVRADSRRGVPNLPMSEGERLQIGVPSGANEKDLDRLVMWESSFTGAGESLRPMAFWAIATEAQAAIGGGTLQGFANSLELVREGELIRISGNLTFRVKDVYDFADGDMFGLRAMEDAGLAKSFVVETHPWRVDVEGYIKLDGDTPIQSRLWLADYRDLVATVSIQRIDPRTGRTITY